MRPVDDKPKGIVMLLVEAPFVITLEKIISENDMVEVERFHHITIRYGIKEYDPKKLQYAFSSFVPTFDTDKAFTKANFFAGVQDGTCDCVYLEINPSVKNSLEEAVRLVEKTVDCAENTFPDYKPHMTLAYVAKGKGKTYADKINEQFNKMKLEDFMLPTGSLFYSDGHDKESTIYMNLL